ncbi:MAG TPA: hypothetical protein VGB55_15760, partial [Tepidisphaeraceae bacterium]
LAPGIGLFGSLASRTDSFTYDLLDDNNDRLFFHQSVAEGGVRYSLDDKFVVLLAGGYAFNQEFRYGWDTRDTEELSKIDDGFFARIEGQFSF